MRPGVAIDEAGVLQLVEPPADGGLRLQRDERVHVVECIDRHRRPRLEAELVEARDDVEDGQRHEADADEAHGLRIERTVVGAYERPLPPRRSRLAAAGGVLP